MPTPRPPKPPTEEIQSAFVDGLSGYIVAKPSDFELAHKPLDLELRPPLPRLVRAYLYAATNPPGERSIGDYKSQLIVPGQGRGPGSFTHLSGVPTLLAGYAFDFDCWILWDAGLHDPFAFSTNVQAKAATVYEAAGWGMARQKKRLRSKPTETIIVCHSSKLAEAIVERLNETAERLAGGQT